LHEPHGSNVGGLEPNEVGAIGLTAVTCDHKNKYYSLGVHALSGL